MKEPKLQWVKVHPSGVWVDRSAFYCIRLYTHASTPPFKKLKLPRYEAWETYPGIQSQRITAARTLPAAKRSCQAHIDRLLVREEAA